jgi:hypothetical protein
MMMIVMMMVVAMVMVMVMVMFMVMVIWQAWLRSSAQAFCFNLCEHGWGHGVFSYLLFMILFLKMLVCHFLHFCVRT